MLEFLSPLQPLGGLPAHLRVQKAPEADAVKASDGAGNMRNDNGDNPAGNSAREWLARLAEPPAPDAPTGPPPTFDIDMLEAQAAEQRDMARGSRLAAERREKAAAGGQNHAGAKWPQPDRHGALSSDPSETTGAPKPGAATSRTARQAPDHPAPAQLDRQV